MAWLFIILALFPAMAPAKALFPSVCAEALMQSRTLSRRLAFTADEKALFQTLLEQLGGRTAVGPQSGGPRWSRSSNGDLEARDASLTVRVAFRNVSEPKVERTSQRLRTLVLPVGFRLSTEPDGGRSLIRRAFLGHPLYPFLVDPQGTHTAERLALDEPALVHREVQSDVIAVGTAMLDAWTEVGDEKDQNLLASSPTGTGKSEIVRALLRHRILQGGRGLYLISSDYTSIVEQLASVAAAVRDGFGDDAPVPLRIVRWDGGRRGTSDAASLETLAKLVTASPVPIVLVTATPSFREQAGATWVAGEGDQMEFALNPAKIRLLRKMLRYWVYDEAHHVGAMQVGRIFEAALNGNAKAASLLITATPDERVQRLARGRGFYTYLDEPHAWLANPKSASRTRGETVLQLRAAFDRGDLASFEELRALIFAQTPGAPVFDSFGRGKPRELREEHYGSLVAQVAPSMRQKPALVAVNSQREALRVAYALSQELGDGYPVAVMTSRYQGQVILEHGHLAVRPLAGDAKELFRERAVRVLVAVDRLNEGVDLPPAEMLVDLNAAVDPEEQMQRLGRLTRTGPGKGYGDLEVYFTQEKTREELIEELNRSRAPVDHHRHRRSGRSAADGAVVVPVALALERIVESGRFDFWNAPPRVPPIVTAENYAQFEPLLAAVKKTFVAGGAFSRVLAAMARALPKERQSEWTKGLREIAPGGFSESLLVNATGTQSAGMANQVLRVVHLYATLRAIPIPDTQFADRRDYEVLLGPFGFDEPVVTRENLGEFRSLLEALKSTGESARHFSQLLSAMERDLPKGRRPEWRRELRVISRGKFNENLLSASAKEGAVGQANQVLRVVRLYARLKNIRIPEGDFRKPEDFARLLAPLGYRPPVVTDTNAAEFLPFLQAVKETFIAATDFDRVLAALEKDLPKGRATDWKKGLKEIAPNGMNRQVLSAVFQKLTPGPVEQVVRIFLLHSRLKWRRAPATQFREQQEFEPVLMHFGYQPKIVTDATAASYVPFFQNVLDTFKASADFAKVTKALEAALPAKQRPAWRRRLPPTAKSILSDTIRRPSAARAETILRIFDLYAELAGLAQSDRTALLVPFGYAPPIVTPANVKSYRPLLLAIQQKFSASSKFSKVIEALERKIPPAAKARWATGLKLIAPHGFRPTTLQDATYHQRATSADQALRVIELYARLCGIPIPATHFAAHEDFARLFAGF